MLRFISLVALSAALVVPATAAPVAGPVVGYAWVRLNPVPGRPSAGYLAIAGTAKPDRLTAVTSPAARVEMHSMTMAGGIMKMATLAGLDVPANGKAGFSPGGNHLMIYGMKPGTTSLPLTLSFASGAKVDTVAAVRKAGADAMPNMAGHDAH